MESTGPRWALAAALVLSVISLVQVIGDTGVQVDSGIEIVSCVLTTAGLYFSFTGDAVGWYRLAVSHRPHRIIDTRDCGIVWHGHALERSTNSESAPAFLH